VGGCRRIANLIEGNGGPQWPTTPHTTASACPSGPITAEVAHLEKRSAAGAMPVNGVLLALHGAVAATFDLHAHVTPP